MQTSIEVKQLARELGIDNIPPLQDINDPALQKLNLLFLNSTVSKSEYPLMLKRIKL